MGVSTSCSALCALKEQPVKFRHVSLSELKTTGILVHGVCWESSPSLGGLSGAEHAGRAAQRAVRAGPAEQHSRRFDQGSGLGAQVFKSRVRGLWFSSC